MGTAEVVLSVVTPCFNDGHFLREAVASAQAVPGGRHEIIVVDDGSTDPLTMTILQEIARQGVRVIHQPNKGLGAARNRAVAATRGRYLLPLDSDNRIKAEYINRGIEVLDRDPTVDVVYGDADYFGERTGRWSVPDFNLRRLLDDNYIDACAIYRRSAWERCGGYDEHMPAMGREDWDLWIRIALTGGRFHHIPEPMFDYRVRADSMTRAMDQSETFERVRRHIYAKRVEMTIGEYAKPQASLDFVLSLVRRRPVHALLTLLVRAFLPSMLPPLPPLPHPNARPAPIQNTTDAPG